MATLGDLNAAIADDLARPDLTSQIAAAITSAITHYWTDRFYFNETRDVSFPTVANQYTYTSADNASIPLFFDFDEIYLIVAANQVRRMRRNDQPRLEYLIANSGSSSGEPLDWAWYNQTLWFYPIPNKAYTVRIAGAYRIAAPTDDSDATNVWISEAYEMIRCYAKGMVLLHTMQDPEGAAIFIGADGKGGQAEIEKSDLMSRGNRTRRFGRVTATEF